MQRLALIAALPVGASIAGMRALAEHRVGPVKVRHTSCPSKLERSR
jgi:hypothetical protein